MLDMGFEPQIREVSVGVILYCVGVFLYFEDNYIPNLI
jgi:hypothetical protein